MTTGVGRCLPILNSLERLRCVSPVCALPLVGPSGWGCPSARKGPALQATSYQEPLPLGQPTIEGPERKWRSRLEAHCPLRCPAGRQERQGAECLTQTPITKAADATATATRGSLPPPQPACRCRFCAQSGVSFPEAWVIKLINLHVRRLGMNNCV